ncbi:unannotated protein [freshwater metagenome]|uniref:Unannotated protein n=1 Tax=freshwater metagenome TaxID=449393 RepID=A0A6J7C542_9ZZZZ
MRRVSIAIWTSGEPVSPGTVPYSAKIAFLVAVSSDIQTSFTGASRVARGAQTLEQSRAAGRPPHSRQVQATSARAWPQTTVAAPRADGGGDGAGQMPEARMPRVSSTSIAIRATRASIPSKVAWPRILATKSIAT